MEKTNKYPYYSKYSGLYMSMKPDFSSIASKPNAEEIKNNVINFQREFGCIIAEKFLKDGMNLTYGERDINDDNNSKVELIKRIDRPFYNGMKVIYLDRTFEECDTLAEKFYHRMFVITELLIHFLGKDMEKWNELMNFDSLASLIRQSYLETDLLQYMELAARDKTVERYSDSHLYQKFSSVANFFFDSTKEYDELYNEIFNEKSDVKQLKKALDKPTQQ